MAAARSIHLNPTGSTYKVITCLKPFFALINVFAYGRLHANQVWKESDLYKGMAYKKIDRFYLLFHVFRFDGNGNSTEVFVCCYQTLP